MQTWVNFFITWEWGAYDFTSTNTKNKQTELCKNTREQFFMEKTL